MATTTKTEPSLFVEPSNELRQGDVCRVKHLPAWKINAYDVQTGSDGKNPRVVVQAAEPEFVVICSHDCDIENVRDRAGLAVAPLSVPAMTWPEDDPKWDLLRSSWQRVDEAFEFGHLFPFEWDGLRGFRVVDLSRLTTAGPSLKAKKMLLDAKEKELADDMRANLQLKLAAFFGRGT